MPKLFTALTAALLLITAACSGGEVAADDSKSTTELQTEAKSMDKPAIQAKIDEYTSAISGKQGEIDGIVAKLKDFNPADLLGDKAKNLKLDQETLMAELSKLQGKLKVYVDELAKR